LKVFCRVSTLCSRCVFRRFGAMSGLYLQVAAEIVGKKGVRELCRNGGNMANQTEKRGEGAVGMSQWKYFARSALSSVNSGENSGGEM